MIYETIFGVLPYVLYSDNFYSDALIIDESIRSRESSNNETGANYNFTIKATFISNNRSIVTKYKSVVTDKAYQYPVPLPGDTLTVWNTNEFEVTKIVPVSTKIYPVKLFKQRLFIHTVFYMILTIILIYFTHKFIKEHL